MTEGPIGSIAEVVRRVLDGGFFASRGFDLRLRHQPDRSVAWEIVSGHLLDVAQTRSRSSFESWEVLLSCGDDSAAAQPLLAVLLQQPGTLYVIRYLRVRGWEAYEAEPNVILSRPVEKLARELVGTVRISAATSHGELAARLERLVFAALVGARLPVTSWESPLPAFQLGQAAYLPGLCRSAGAAGAEDSSEAVDEMIAAISSPAELLRQVLAADVPVVVRAKGLETALRAAATGDVPGLVAVLVAALHQAWGRHSCVPDRLSGRQECLLHEEPASRMRSLFLSLFNYVALTPYTQFADNLVALLLNLAHTMDEGAAIVIDVISYMLRHLVRHLTAFDLRTFHNRGANYPDALFLDRLLKAYLEMMEPHREHFPAADGDDVRTIRAKRRRRRALRQAWIVRKQYEGLKIPESPTSPGDLQRVLPDEYACASEEEVFDPAKRRKTLFADDPLEQHLRPGTQNLLRQGADDLAQAAELRELGMATFLDRPLGIAKRPGEIDRTPLLTYEAFSESIARERLSALCCLGLLTQERRDALTELLGRETSGPPARWAVASYAGHQGRLPARPGTPCLEDANLAAPDFVFLRTSRTSLDEFLGCFDLGQLRNKLPADCGWLTSGKDVLLVRVVGQMPAAGRPLLQAIDRSGIVRGSLSFRAGGDGRVAYREEGGRELPVFGLEWKSGNSAIEQGAEPVPLEQSPAIVLPASWWSSF